MEPDQSPPPSLRRALVVGWLSAVIIIVWWVTDYPWNGGFLPYALINTALAALLMVRVIRWPAFLWLVFLAWFLSWLFVPMA